MKLTINNSLALANVLKAESIAIPALCSGLYHYPTWLVTNIVLEAILSCNQHERAPKLKRYVLMDIHAGKSKTMSA